MQKRMVMSTRRFIAAKRLGAGARIAGPAIVEQLDSTVVLSPGTE